MDIYEMALKKTLEEYDNDYLQVIQKKEEIALKVIENLVKIRKYLDRHPTFLNYEK